jgi:hypothetical protein
MSDDYAQHADQYERYSRKQAQRLRQQYEIGGKYVIVYRGQHQTDYYDASTPELLFSNCLKLLQQLSDQGLQFDLEDPVLPALSLQQAQGLPDGRIKQLALQEHQQYAQGLAHAAENRLRAAWLADTLERQDGEMAQAVLHDVFSEVYRLELLF